MKSTSEAPVSVEGLGGQDKSRKALGCGYGGFRLVCNALMSLEPIIPNFLNSLNPCYSCGFGKLRLLNV